MAVPKAILEVSYILISESVMCLSVAIMLARVPEALLSIALRSTLIEASNVHVSAIMIYNSSAACH